MSRKPHILALRASLFYGVLAGLWILFSDRLLAELVKDSKQLTELEIYKGWAFVGFTGIMFFLILRQLLANEQQKIRQLQQAELLASLQRETLERFALNKPLPETLTHLLRGIEALSPEMICSVLMLDANGRHLRHGAAPSLPEDFNRAIDGAAIGAKAGSCGTAAFRGSPVFVSDIARDPLWTDYKALALPHGLRACWSTPILDEQKKVLGTFAIYHRTTGLPSEADVRIIELVTHTVATGLIKLRAEKALRASEERFRTLVEQASDAIYVHDTAGRLLDVNQSACKSLGYSRKELLQLTVTDVAADHPLAKAREIWNQLRPGQSQIVRDRHRRKDGTLFPVEVNVTCYEVQGELVLAALARNMSERKEYEEQLAQSVSLLRATIESSSSGLLVVDFNGRVTLYNQRFLEMWRLPAEAMAQSRYEDLLKLVQAQLAEPEVFLQRIRELDQQPEADSSDTFHSKDGRIFQRLSRPQRLGDKIIGRIWNFRDITEQQQAERAMKEERRLLRTLIDLQPDFIFVKDTASRFLVVNQALAKIYGRTPTELIGRTDAELLPSDLAERFRRSEVKVIASGELHTVEDTICFPDGQTRTVCTNMAAFRDEHGRVSGLVGIGHDVTQKKLTEKLVRLQSLALNTADNAVMITDAHGNIEWVNPAFSQTSGYTLAECVGKNPRELVRSGRHAPEFYAQMWETILAGTAWHGELTNRRKDGTLFEEEMTITPLRNDGGQITHFIAIKQDITRRREMEETLRRAAERTQFYMQRLPLAFIAWNRDFCVTEWNVAAEKIFGWSADEAMGQHAYKLIVPPDAQNLVSQVWQEIIADGNMSSHSINDNISKSGRRLTCEWHNMPWRNAQGQISGCLSIVEDITDRIQNEKKRTELEAQLRQSQKMEAVGQLSGGIAHDFNNILTVIQGNAALLQNLDLEPAETRDCSNQISRAAERAAGLTRQLLMFARKQEMKLVNLDVNETIAQITKMLNRILGEDITLRAEYAPTLPLIHADIGMIEQIIMNLAVNARDAMTHGGKLTLRTGTEKRVNQDTGLEEICVRLEIADTGCGIAPEILPRIFEPFFTTKEIGKGTGLGLATVYGIVEQHHGTIKVQSVLGKGTTFILTFPSISETEIIRAAKAAQPALPWGTETILLVEDEPPLRAFVSDLLQRCGYTVIEAGSGPAALKVWQEKRSAIQLLFTDVIMPEDMDGLELAQRLLAEKPDLKVIYTSGYTGNLENRQVDLVEGRNFIRKPYRPEALATILRKRLDET
jgi:two-component system, cell cycle sensor histidine kinase and response regulator CckA